MAQLPYSQLLSILLTWARAEDRAIFNSVVHWSHAVVFGVRVTTAQLYPSRDTFKFFDLGYMTKNQDE